MSNCCCKVKLLEISRLLSHADMRVSNVRVAGRGSRVAGRGSRVQKIVAGLENCCGSKNSTLIVKIELFFILT